MEHPATAEDERQVASSWLLEETKHLQQQPDVDLVTFDQCMTGQTARKPTSLLCIHAPQSRSGITQLPNLGRCNHGVVALCFVCDARTVDLPQRFHPVFLSAEVRRDTCRGLSARWRFVGRHASASPLRFLATSMPKCQWLGTEDTRHGFPPMWQIQLHRHVQSSTEFRGCKLTSTLHQVRSSDWRARSRFAMKCQRGALASSVRKRRRAVLERNVAGILDTVLSMTNCFGTSDRADSFCTLTRSSTLSKTRPSPVSPPLQ